MPVYEERCLDLDCSGRQPVEHFYWHADQTPMRCETCGGEQERLISRFGVVFTGEITRKYHSKSAEPTADEGHWAYRVRSSSTGQPEPVYIDTWQKQKEFCREEGLVNPKELPSNAQVSSDGKKLESTGMPGQWI